MIDNDPEMKVILINRLNLISVCTKIFENHVFDKTASKKLFLHVLELLKYMFIKNDEAIY